MKPSKPGSPVHRLRLWLWKQTSRFDRFTARPRVAEVVAAVAHCTPLVWVVVTVFMAGRELLAPDFRHPLLRVAVLVVAVTSLAVQLAHLPGRCRRCQRRMPWGKDRVHAGRRALLWSYHTSWMFDGVLFLVLLAFLVSGWRDASLLGMNPDRLADVAAWPIGLVTLGWLGQARMTHTMYERACPRCRTRRGGGGPRGGQPLPVAELPVSKTA